MGKTSKHSVRDNAGYVILTEHGKLQGVKHLSQAIGDFLEWLEEQRIELQTYVEGQGYVPHHESREKILARHFEIDLNRLECEKVAILEDLRVPPRVQPNINIDCISSKEYAVDGIRYRVEVVNGTLELFGWKGYRFDGQKYVEHVADHLDSAAGNIISTLECHLATKAAGL